MSTDLPLHVVSETSKTITLGWEPPQGCEGYVFRANGKTSSTLDGSRTSVKFSKPGPYSVEAIGTLATGVYPTPDVPSGLTIPTYHVEITPNQYDTRDGADANYQVCWLDHTSDHGARTLERSVSDEWWMEWQFRIGVTWDTAKQGEWGRMFNSHVDWTAPGADDVTSAQAVDYIGGKLIYHSEPGGNRDWTIHPALPKNVWHTLRWRTVLGRVDGGTPRPGQAQIWLNGGLVVDTGPINTIYRWTNGSLEAHQWLWNGFYSKGIQMVLPFDMTFCRFGKSLAEMLADTGWKASTFRLSDHLIPGKQDYGPATAVRIADRTLGS